MRDTSHVVAAITFRPRSNDGPCKCSCGLQMLASQFGAHRRAQGLTSNASDLRAGEAKYAASYWRRSIA